MELPYTAGRTRNYTKHGKTLSTTVCKMASADVTLDVRMFRCKPHDLQRVPQHNQRAQVCLHAISIVAIYPARTTVVDNDISESGAGRALSIETVTTWPDKHMRIKYKEIINNNANAKQGPRTTQDKHARENTLHAMPCTIDS